jgi:hypothetical protein
VLLEISHIEWIEAQGDYVAIHADRENYLTRETMQAMESHLKSHKFVRIHRSVIVNLGSVAQLQPVWSGDYKVTLRSGASLLGAGPSGRGSTKPSGIMRQDPAKIPVEHSGPGEANDSDVVMFSGFR